MEPINLDIALSLKVYVDLRDRKMERMVYDPYNYGFFTLEFFEAGWIKELIDNEYGKCVVTRDDGLFSARMMISGVIHTMSSNSEEELKRNFIRFLLNY